MNQFETESKELGDYAGNELVDRYADLRTAQTKFEDNLLGSLKLVGDRLRELDALYDVNIRRVIG